ncbi:hypothetical protein [Oryzomonas rubra]|uniref:Uncharacterized protein n=1 Tax=Oryzomonas rubra TaxID=2509454 RepID=A0A5A9X7T3_9BACT|nr:hypothetical protein [Oryzomonas rubra]KAA0888713.1 hypothetical protein ET418_15140 [Oryzomonas rubra]
MAKKHAGGRPTKFNQDVADKIIAAIRNGNYMDVAAAFGGITKETLYAWMREGASKTKGPMHEFSDSVRKALADAEATDLALIRKAALDGAWQAAAWRLERRFKSRWGKTIDVTNDLKNKTNEELLALLEDADTDGVGAA